MLNLENESSDSDDLYVPIRQRHGTSLNNISTKPNNIISENNQQKSLLDINIELVREKGELTEEQKRKAEEDYVLSYLSKERQPLVRKSTKEKDDDGIHCMATGWSPPQHILEQTEEQHKYLRVKNNIDTLGEDIPPPISTFKSMRLPAPILVALHNKHVMSPTPIQIQGLPVVLSGRDMIGIASTGSGKTMVFALPLVLVAMRHELINPLTKTKSRDNDRDRYSDRDRYNDRNDARYDNRDRYRNNERDRDRDRDYYDDSNSNFGPIGLVVVPLRELATQIRSIVDDFSNHLSEAGYPVLNNLLAIGGIKMSDEWRRIKGNGGVHTISATPGSLAGLIKTKKICLDRCVYLAFDESDRLVEPNFEEEMKILFSSFKYPHQTVFFSATMPKRVQELSITAMTNPIVVKGGHAGRANQDIIQEIEFIKSEMKLDYILSCLQKTAPPVLIFARSQYHVDEVCEHLMRNGVEVASIHGGKLQEERLQVIEDYKSGAIDVLVATDVASKGLDFDKIQHVINFDMPSEIEDYIHRIGRTGRKGNVGVATSFINNECNQTLLLDLKHVLKDAGQLIHPMLNTIDDPSEYIKEGDEDKSCEYCGGMGHSVLDCPKWIKINRSKTSNSYGFDIATNEM